MSLEPEAKPLPAHDRHLPLLLLAVTVVTGYRLALALSSGLTLYVDEAQYWLWAQNLDWGYFSKPPMIALAIWLPTQVCGDSEPCIRAAPLIAYPITTLLVYAAARRLFDNRTALLAGLVFLTMPGVSLSSLIISTDVLLFLFWALALGGMAVALMYLGGLKPLQTASLIVAVPLIFVIALCVWSFLRWLREDQEKGALWPRED